MVQAKHIGEANVDGTAARLGTLVVAPILGLIYAIFLPFIGIAMLVQMVGVKLLGGLAHNASKGLSFGWRPVEAYLTGKKGKKSEKK
ncbi:MAG TPA: hypothetical protein VF790_06360 [Dissulfurispiraceae bacterium]